MDGRTAAMNVLLGVMIGSLVPIIGAVVLARAHPDFEWIDHTFTIFLLSIACGSIGALVNLPWNETVQTEYQPHVADTADPTNHRTLHSQKHETTGDATDEHEETRGESHDSNREVPSPSKRYAMSRREALRTLDLEHDADEIAVRDAFRKLALTHHPDHAAAKGEEAVALATAKFQQIRAAYDVLIDDVT